MSDPITESNHIL